MKKTITNIQSHFVELCRKLVSGQHPNESDENPRVEGNSLKSRLAKHFVACSAAAVVAAGSVGDASAAIVSWNNANLVIPATIDGLYINVQTQVTGSAGSVVAGWDINPYSATSLTWFNATGTGMMRYPGVTTGSAGNLALGTSVGATGSYGSGAVVVGSAAGNWQLNADNYFGFRFIAADGLTHYGWGRMTVGAAITTRTIADLHFEDVPTTPIIVGSTSAGGFCLAPTLSATTVAAVCQGGSGGSINLTLSGGLPSPFTFLWSTGATTEDLSNLAAGSYTVTVTTQGGGCTATGSYTVADGPAPPLWYVDTDGDGFGDASSSQSACTQPPGYAANSTDCNDANASINPGASELCNTIDDNCDGSTDEGLTPPTTTATGCGTYTWSVNGQTYTSSGTYTAGGASSSIYTSLAAFTAAVSTAGHTLSATENFSGFNGFYSSLSGSLGGSPAWSASASGGIYCGTVGGDMSLSTNNPEPLTISFSPSVAAVGANIFLTDINFNPVSGTVYISLSNGTVDTVSVSSSNNFSGYVSNNAQISSITIAGNSGPVFVTVDNLSVGTGTITPPASCSIPVLVLTINTPSTYYADSDGDGYGDASSSQSVCSQPTGYVSNNTDCNDTDNSVNPGVASDLCNGVDNDCDGSTDEDASFSNYYVDTDGDGYGAGSPTSSCSPITGSVTTSGDCNDGDNSVNPGVATDGCNSVDNDCDGSTDEDATFSNYYVDGDSDGYGAGAATSSCATISGSVTTDGDCNDNSAAVNPAATEVCNSIDDNCDGLTDNNPLPSAPGTITGIIQDCRSRVAGTASFTLTGVTGASGIAWTVPSGFVITSGQGTSSITVSYTASAIDVGISGPLCANISDACGSSVSTCVNVDYQISAPVRPASVSGPSKVCTGETATYSIANPVRSKSLNWAVPAGATIVSGQGTNIITVNFGNAFTGGDIVVNSSNVCGSSPDRIKNIGLNILSAPASISGPVSGLCGLTGVTYSASTVAGATAYNWTVPAGATIVSGQGTTTLVVDYSGSFTSGSVTASGQNGCGNGAARSVSVTGVPGLPSTISGPFSLCVNQSYNFSVNTVAGATSYNWLVPGGMQITSGQGTKDVVVKAGAGIASGLNISVRASNGCGTGLVSNRGGISVVSCSRYSENSAMNLVAYPNPASDRTHVVFEAASECAYTLQMTDMSGRQVVVQSGTASKGRNEFDLVFGNLSYGVYFIDIRTEEQSSRLRIVVAD